MTHLPYVEEFQAVTRMLARADSSELGPAVDRLPKFRQILDRIREHNDAYGAALQRGTPLGVVD